MVPKSVPESPLGSTVLLSRLNADTVHQVRAFLTQRLQREQRLITLRLSSALAACGVVAPTRELAAGTGHILDRDWVSAISELALRRRLSPATLVELVRGQSPSDYRPNKAMYPLELKQLYLHHPQVSLMVDIASVGFHGPWAGPRPAQPGPPPNHGSARQHQSTVMRLLCAGHIDGHYLLLDKQVLELWHNQVFYSPLGLVPKGDVPLEVHGRLIHDLSFPAGGSVNSCTSKEELPLVEWPRISTLARRITSVHAEGLGSSLWGMSADIAHAYRHLRCHASECAWFGLTMDEPAIIGLDLSAAFGWAGSANVYCVFGNAITWLVKRESPHSLNPGSDTDSEPFWAYNYIDDYVSLEVRRGSRLDDAATALELAMLATFGPHAVNAQKVQPWSQCLHALGLDWDLRQATVSMPQPKIAKACQRVTAMLSHGRASRSDLDKVLGSLRHVCSCVRPAWAFAQSVRSWHKSLPRFGSRALPSDVAQDLAWFRTILDSVPLADIPTSLFSGSTDPSLELFMDASDSGLAIIDPTTRRFIRLDFDATELALIQTDIVPTDLTNQTTASKRTQPPNFSINVREHFAIGLAVCIWGADWSDPVGLSTTHVLVRTDSTAAESWCNGLTSPNPLAANTNRHMALAMAQHRLHISARHVAGLDNSIADAGSRLDSAPHSAFWSQATLGWTETPIPVWCRHMYLGFNGDMLSRWPTRRGDATVAPGLNGRDGAPSAAAAHGSIPPQIDTPLHFGSSPCASTTSPYVPTELQPSAANSRQSPGSTNAPAASPPVSSVATIEPFTDSHVNDHLPMPSAPYPQPYCGKPGAASASKSPRTASSGGLRSWVTSLF